jgi:hypothetical protein
MDLTIPPLALASADQEMGGRRPVRNILFAVFLIEIMNS